MYDVRKAYPAPTSVQFADFDGGAKRINHFKQGGSHTSFEVMTHEQCKVGHIHYEDIDSMIAALQEIKVTWKKSHPLREGKEVPYKLPTHFHFVKANQPGTFTMRRGADEIYRSGSFEWYKEECLENIKDGTWRIV